MFSFKDLSQTTETAETGFDPSDSQVTPEEALRKRREASRLYVFDLRSPEAYQAGHLPGAYSLPLEYLENALYQMPYQGEIMFYGGGQGEGANAATLLYDNGFDSFFWVDDYAELQATLERSPEDLKLGQIPEAQRLPVIETILDEKIRPALASDGGGLSVLNLDGNKLFVEYHGACGSCSSSTSGTLKFIENQLTISLNHDMEVIPA